MAIKTKPMQATATNGQHAPPTARKLPTGTLSVEVAGMAYSLDLTELQLATEVTERKHNATPGNPNWYTPEFLRDLAQAYTDLGIANCTPTQAALLREETGVRYAELRHDFFLTPGSHGATE